MTVRQGGDNVQQLSAQMASTGRRITQLERVFRREWNWRGVWEGGEYRFNDVTRDGEYTMVCTNPDGCTTRPAPVPVGDPFNVYPGIITTLQDTQAQIIAGMRYVFSDAAYVTGYRVYTHPGQEYGIYQVLSNDELVLIQIFTGDTEGWQEFSITPTLTGVGVEFSLVSIINEADPVTVDVPADYDYQKPNNPAVPGPGQIIHDNKNQSRLRIDKTDFDTTDRSALLAALVPGDQISTPGLVWDVQTNLDFGTYVEIGIAPAAQLPTTGVETFIFQTVVAIPLNYAKDLDYWSLNPPVGATIRGLFSDSGGDNVVEDDSQYGMDLQVQDVTHSGEWELVAFSGTGTGGGASFLNDLADVDTTGKADGQRLAWDEDLALWIPKTSTSALGIVQFTYRVNTTVDPTPASGRISGNNLDPTLITIVYINKVNDDANDISLFLENLTAGDWLNIHDNTDSNRHRSYDVTANPVLVGDVWQIPVTFFSQAGTALTNNQKVDVLLRFTPSTPPGWRHFQTFNPGEVTSFDVPVPPGAVRMRWTATGGNSGVGDIQVSVNGDGALTYRVKSFRWNSDGTFNNEVANAAATSIPVAYWAGNDHNHLTGTFDNLGTTSTVCTARSLLRQASGGGVFTMDTEATIVGLADPPTFLRFIAATPPFRANTKLWVEGYYE